MMSGTHTDISQRKQVEERVRHEMLEIFYARNMPR